MFPDNLNLRALSSRPLDTRLVPVHDYDPLAGTGGGFLRQTLARLTLHLSIGEAY
jgi:hypothetical protein